MLRIIQRVIQFKKILLLLCGCALLSSCALSTKQINFQYQPQYGVAKKLHSQPVYVESVYDERGLPANLIQHYTDANYDVASGGVATPQPIADYLRLALHTALVKAGYQVKSDSKTPLHLQVQLLRLHCGSYGTFFGSAKLYCVMTTNVQLMNVHTKKQLWSNTLFAKAHGHNLATAFNALLNRTGIILANNPSFQNKTK